MTRSNPFRLDDKNAVVTGGAMGIGLALGTRPVADRCTEVIVERDERKPTFGEGKPGDHAPTIVTLR